MSLLPTARYDNQRHQGYRTGRAIVRDEVDQGASIDGLCCAGQTVSNTTRPGATARDAAAEYIRSAFGHVCATSVAAIICSRAPLLRIWMFHARPRRRRCSLNRCLADARKRYAHPVHCRPDRRADGLRVVCRRASLHLSCGGQERSSDRCSMCGHAHRQRAGRLRRVVTARWRTASTVALRFASGGRKKSFGTCHFFSPFALGARQQCPLSALARRTHAGGELTLALANRAGGGLNQSGRGGTPCWCGCCRRSRNTRWTSRRRSRSP